MRRRYWFDLMSLVLLLAALCLSGGMAHAGAGFGFSTYSSGGTRVVPTYYANSVSIPGSGTPEEMRKFVDGLPGVPGVTPFGANNLGQYIPVAVPEKWVNGNGVTTNDDYYEIAVVEYTERLHSDLPKATTLRGYVQLETPSLYAAAKSNHVALYYPDGSPITDSLGNQIYALDNPHYLGPMIVATRDTAVRIKFTNLLPKGRFDSTTGLRNGDLFLPVDETLMGAGLGPDGTNRYTQNGALLHLHGGDTPWISDGTPHQWIVPAAENTPWPAGVSQHNVPDMPDPGPGSATYYYPNGQSARLMFYHDHTLGFTRLNVYAGEAAGYLVQDQPGKGENLLPLANVPQIPLIIQEKTFVPTDVAVQDAKWDTTHWGKPGDLWFPHVYETNQDPTSYDGTNPVGRWDWGPWFWPVFPAPEGLPTGVYGDVTTTPEAFGDTPLVNGTAYPTVTLEPKAYRFRILNASNDRMFNLGLYLADSSVVSSDGRSDTEVKMVPAAVAALPACAAGAPVNQVTGLPDNCWPATWPADGRDGGVPDPTTAGPKMIQIGNEGGLLPQAAVIPSQPSNYEYMRRSITVLNVSDHGLFLGSAERADVVVDFSQYAGKTLILYNDAPAPVPAFDARIDYYTGDPDQTDSGGWFSTPAGFGPNTRTIMQIKISGTTNGTPFDEAALKAALPVAYADSQPKPVVAESVYNAPFGTLFQDRYAKIFTGSATQHTFDFIAGDTISYLPEGATTPVTVTEGQLAQIPVQNKAIQELFDSHGRMNATLGVEIPFTGSNIQTTVPLGYIDPATETIADGETQIWKITHNGVDTHPVHFHLVNVQLINRVGWDGTVKPPSENEVGWKETVRMNPLEDVIVAVRAKKPALPGFGVPGSSRYLAPAEGPGSAMGFSNLDPLTGNAANPPVSNTLSDFGWEYVWHCHILGHEENDFMRPFIFRVTEAIPAAPTGLAAVAPAAPTVNLTWTDNADNEISYLIERAVGDSTTFTAIGKALANATSFIDNTITTVTPAGFKYRVTAIGAAGPSAPSNEATVILPVATASGVNLTADLPGPQPAGTKVTFTATGTGGTGSYEYQFQIQAPGGTLTTVQNYSTSGTYVWYSPNVAGAYTITVNVRNQGSTAAAEATTGMAYQLLLAPASGATLVSDKPSPQPAGTAITFTAGGIGGSGSYEYQFQIQQPGGTLSTVQGYSTSNTYLWNSSVLGAGTYTVNVNVRNQGSTAAAEASQSMSYVLTVPAATGATLTSDKASPQPVSAQVTFTAAGQGGTGVYEYQFQVQSPTGTWSTVKGYSTGNTFAWNTAASAAGTYNVKVNVRSQGSTRAVEASTQLSYTLVGPATGASLTADKPSGQISGTVVTFTASGSGGLGEYEYQFQVQSPGSNVWQTAQGYSTSNTFAWNTTGLATGTYTVKVNVRNIGSTRAVEASRTMSFSLVYIRPATGATLMVYPSQTVTVGTPARFTASGQGGTGKYQYEFLIQPPGGTYNVVRGYSTINSYTWNTTGLARGTYNVAVYVRSMGSVVPVEASRTITMTLK